MITTSSSPTHRRRFILRCIGVLASLALLATACGADDGGAADATTTTVPPVTSSNPPGSAPEATPPGESDATPEDPGSTPGSGFTAQPLPSGSAIDDLEGPVEPALMPLVEKAIADLSMRLGVPAAEISVVRAESVVWPDSSRGCPQPGMSYLMVLTDGVWIVLVHGSAAYEYRTDGAGNVTLCESTVKQRPVEGKAPGFGDS